MSAGDVFEQPVHHAVVSAAASTPLFGKGVRVVRDAFSYASAVASDQIGDQIKAPSAFDIPSCADDRESGKAGGHRRSETAQSDRCLAELGDITRKGLGWAAPATEADTTQVTEDLRVALWSDGSMEIADGDMRLSLSPEKAEKFFTYTDLVRHVGGFAE